MCVWHCVCDTVCVCVFVCVCLRARAPVKSVEVSGTARLAHMRRIGSEESMTMDVLDDEYGAATEVRARASSLPTNVTVQLGAPGVHGAHDRHRVDAAGGAGEAPARVPNAAGVEAQTYTGRWLVSRLRLRTGPWASGAQLQVRAAGAEFPRRHQQGVERLRPPPSLPSRQPHCRCR